MLYQNKKIQKRNRRKSVLLLAIAVACIVIAGITWRFYSNGREDFNDSGNNTSNDNVNYSPPTELESESGDKVKENQPDQNNTPNTNTPTTTSAPKKSVKPVLTSAEMYEGNLEVSGYVSEMIEKGGICTAIARNGSKTATSKQAALDDAQYTSCGVILIPKSKLSNGTWTISLNYESAKYSGTSAATTRSIKL